MGGRKVEEEGKEVKKKRSADKGEMRRTNRRAVMSSHLRQIIQAPSSRNEQRTNPFVCHLFQRAICHFEATRPAVDRSTTQATTNKATQW